MTEKERLPGIPPALWKYPLFSSRGKGTCLALAGRVRLTFLFTDIPGYRWTYRDKQEAKAVHAQSLKLVERDARRYGVRLELRTDCISSGVNEEVTMGNCAQWAEKALAGAQLPGCADAGTLLKKRFGVDSAPICFCINGTGRSFAHCNGATEFIVLFSQNALFHELCHLYGAEDFYFPEKLAELTGKYYPNSIMRGSSVENPEVDGFTAYLIGWTDKLAGRDLQFLKELEKIPLSDFTEALKTEHFTGDAANLRTRHGTYTGSMVDGEPHGRGKYVYNSGSVYEGAFLRGYFHGTGEYTSKEKNRWIGTYVLGKLEGEAKLIFSDGGRFQGRYENDVREGFGTMMWADGSRYSGDFRGGQRTGYGIYTWPDGSSYEGEFLEGEMHGIGTKHYTDGSSYEGQFSRGKLQGKGTYRFPNGAFYTGQFQDGRFQGYGEYHFSDGAVYQGNFEKDQRSGKGTMTWPDGSCYTGEFVQGQRSGQGTYRFPNRDVYTGQFREGRKHGRGTYTFCDGSTKTGRWENDKFIG